MRFELDFKSHIKYATAEEQDFLAVYDKKMLWRANLYIDEGVNDWNNIHPWNAPPVIADAITYGQAFDEKGKVTRQFLKADSNIDQNTQDIGNDIWIITGGEKVWYGPNEWNRVINTLEDTDGDSENTGANHFAYTGSETDYDNLNKENLTNLKRGNGKQVVIIPDAVYINRSTDGNISHQAVVKDYTVYNFARTTTPFEYAYHMFKQNEAMRAKEAEENNSQNVQNLKQAVTSAETAYNNATPENKEELKQALKQAQNNLKAAMSIYTDIGYSTLPPDNLWKNYVRNSYRPALKDFVFPQAAALNGENLPVPQNNYTSVQFPFQQQTGEYNKEAGVDCGGLIYAAEMYHETPYLRRDMNGEKLSAADGGRFNSYHDIGPGFAVYAPSNNLYSIMRKSDYNLEPPDNRKRVVPGDIIYYNDTENNSYHVMIVQNVERPKGTRAVEIKDIKLIESTYGNSYGFYGVSKKHDLTIYHKEEEKTWYLGRIKTQ